MVKTVVDVADISTRFERCNTDLKRRYLLEHIEVFKKITAGMAVGRGAFGTGYPFYALNSDLTGELPVIQEQIRYNEELVMHAMNSQRDTWSCGICLYANYGEMPDLKRVCKPCPNMDYELKPRKVINRLPDMDLWMICEDGKVEEAQAQLAEALKRANFSTSDVDPLKSIQDIIEITESLESGIMPQKFLPIDVHIIEYSKMKELIQQVPEIIRRSRELGKVPYLPIQPKSYRKQWQYDDEAYNFINDFLAHFTELSFDEELKGVLDMSRSELARTYSIRELYEILLKAAKVPNFRRFGEKPLQIQFIKKCREWKKIRILEEQEKVEEQPMDSILNSLVEAHDSAR